MNIESGQGLSRKMRLDGALSRGLGFLYTQSRHRLFAILIILIMPVAAADYLTGVELSFSIFYLVAISIATWFAGRNSGLFISIISVGCWLAGDLAAGARYSSHFVPWWNAMITLSFYCAMVVALSSLRNLHLQLEDRVRDRTLALRKEITERERLEKALLAVSEREQRRIGHDVHDSLCQHLTGAAIAGQVLADKLEVKSLPESSDAAQLVAIIEDGIELARNLARGLAPVQLEADGLMAAFCEFARTTTQRFGIDCSFHAPHPVLINNPEMAIHFFRIAQEAVSNAIKHGRARHIVISLLLDNAEVELSVSDDGKGLPDPLQPTNGMGLHIMRHRAAMIAGSFQAKGSYTGTIVRCRAAHQAEGGLR